PRARASSRRLGMGWRLGRVRRPRDLWLWPRRRVLAWIQLLLFELLRGWWVLIFKLAGGGVFCGGRSPPCRWIFPPFPAVLRAALSGRRSDAADVHRAQSRRQPGDSGMDAAI